MALGSWTQRAQLTVTFLGYIFRAYTWDLLACNAICSMYVCMCVDMMCIMYMRGTGVEAITCPVDISAMYAIIENIP